VAKEWRCAVVGVGVVGDWHVRVIPSVPGAKLVAVCDADPEKPRKSLEKINASQTPIYTDLKKMLAKEQIDVVHIATPSGAHLKPAITAMEAGVNVICEKPMEIKLDRVDKMIDTAAQRNVKLAGIFQNRWNQSNRMLKQAAVEGRFGTLAWAGCFTPWWRTNQYYEEGGWRGTWKLDGGGAIMNQSVHAVDLLQWIAGPIRKVSAYAASRAHPAIEVEDTLSCSLEFESGAFGTIMGSTAMYPGGGVRIEIGGENGHAVSEGGLKTFRFRDERPEDKEMIEALKNKTASPAGTSAVDQGLELHFRNISAIFKSWEDGQEAETNGPEARKAVAIILAMYKSAKKGGSPVTVS
jgi:predicted dehydrogenase